MTNYLVFSALSIYILLLYVFAQMAKSKGDNDAFFRAGRKSPWLLVAFGMIGSSISGVSLVSVPGWVNQNGMTYIQMCLGFFAGFVVIAFLLLPLYYRLRLTSIYTYLAERFGRRSHLTGSCFFLLSKLTGAAARLYLTCTVLHEMAIRPLELPFWFTVGVVLVAIFLYTRRGGTENLIRTDALQTFCMLLATAFIFWGVSAKMNLTPSSIANTIAQNPMGQLFCWDTSSTQFFFRQFINGMFITIVMNGIDQDMMQKNLTCSSLRAAQKNMCLYGACILPVNFLFLALGVLLYTFAAQSGIAIPDAGDRLLPMLVGSGALGTLVVFPFTIGITAAALSSADSAMTALTTSICVDILRIERKGFDVKKALHTRHYVHATVALAFALCITVFHIAGSGTIIDTIYRLAGYTYGPLLGLFCFGLFTHRRVMDRAVPYIAIISPIICILLDFLAPIFWNYHFSYELLLINTTLTFLGLLIFSRNRIIKNIVFDLGGVVVALNHEQAIKRFESIGLKDARQHLDAFEQKGIFGDLEAGRISVGDFREELSKMIGKNLTEDECRTAWMGYMDHVPKRNLETILSLRERGYKVCLLSNTNPFIMQWAKKDFDGEGHSISYFFDALYLSYECKVMKPRKEIFEMMLRGQQSSPEETIFIDDGRRNIETAAAMGMHTLCPQNNEDWTAALENMLRQ